MTGRSRFAGSYFLVAAAGMFLGFPAFLAALYVPFPWAWGFIFLASSAVPEHGPDQHRAGQRDASPSIRAMAFAVNIFIIHALGDAISPPIHWRHHRYAANKNMNVGFLAVSLP